MSIKKNFFYNSILTVSNYIFPLIVFPYISRVLGVTNIGICNFVDSMVNYCVLFSMLGITIIGIREVAMNSKNKEVLEEKFSSLFLLNTIYTIIVLVIYLIAIYSVPKLYEYKNLLCIGVFKIIFNLFLIEWFFKGIEHFKYITARSLIIRVAYVISIFTFVRDQNDFEIYYLLTVLIVVVNAIYNWIYRRKIVSFIFNVNLKQYIKPSLSLGIYMILTSMYTSFNVIYLGFVTNDEQVGFYTTAIKLHSILLALFTAFTTVMLPRVSSFISEGNMDEVCRLANRSFDLLFAFCFPVMIFSIIFAPQIINVISGPSFDGAIIPMRIVMPLLLIIGIEQIVIIQLLMPMKRDKFILQNSILGAIIGIALNVLLVSTLQSIGSSIVWLSAELAILIAALCYLKKKTNIRFPLKSFVKSIILSVPYLIICYSVYILQFSYIFTLILASSFCFIYFIIINYFILKDDLFIQTENKIKHIIFRKKDR